MSRKKKNGNGNSKSVAKSKTFKKKDCPSCLGLGKIPLGVYGNNPNYAGVAWEMCSLCYGG